MKVEKKKKNGKNVSERTHTRSGMKRKFADVLISKRKKRRSNTRKTRLVQLLVDTIENKSQAFSSIIENNKNEKLTEKNRSIDVDR